MISAPAHPTVDVIIPNYNRPHSLKQAIQSALNQDLPVSHIWVADDGSSESPEPVIAAYRDKRIHLLNGIHSGLPARHRNRALQESTSEWVAFLDNDDLWQSDKLRKQLEAAHQHNASFVCTNAYLWNPQKSEKSIAVLKREDSWLYTEDLIKRNFVVMSSVLVKRELIQKAGGFPVERKFRSTNDYLLWLRLSLDAPLFFLKEPLVIYCNDDSTSMRSEEKIHWQLLHMTVFSNFLFWAAGKKAGVKIGILTIRKILSHFFSYLRNQLGIFLRRLKKSAHVSY